VTPDAVAAALIAGRTPEVGDMTAYWLATDAGRRPKVETVAVLAALSAAPPRAARIEAFVRYVRDSYEPVRLPAAARAINIVGTGGGQPTFNISTTAAFVAAAAGARVLKSGSSAYSSAVGSGDILAALGLSRALPHDRLDEMLDSVGIAFAPASAYAPICRRLAIAAMPLPFKVIGRFVNLLGPLICPYEVAGAVVGAADEGVFDILRQVGRATGQRLLCVHSLLGVDELLSIGDNRIAWAHLDTEMRLSGGDLGYRAAPLALLQGGTLDHNVELLKTLLRGQGPAAATETVALNAGAVLYAAGRVATLAEGASVARDCLRDGAPHDLLRKAQRFVREVRTVLEAAE
jgi:anthranilate phosphoribosyltransferase